MNQQIYQLISFLLHYPNEEMVEILPELDREIEKTEDILIRDCLQQFVKYSKKISLEEWISHYIEHFDFGRITNLYVTYLKLGEQRERGLELLKLKKFYEAHGFEVTEKELPDYLPLMLEFCANTPIETSNELLMMHIKAIEEIRKKVTETGSYYHLLFDALMLQMANNGLSTTLVSKEIH
ncbi:nitrate reductase molybdenum cofactor assembly chaperone [Oceanobacillus senegalensis]|uniref:nitrate reductase molybdenum cofactor assembly chaperone n=1 Tax=Oceanobacillus senegalensis TaxID=1936063 RepID=UPI000A304A70|nr:nitrate reductase molybdenum cofactor assembly chaperone [Oceanobacillus senegalensis]